MGILFSCSVILGIEYNYELSNDILHFLLGYYLNLNTDNIYDRALTPKLYYILSYNSHSLDLHQKALELATAGIEYCINNDSLAFLPLLLGRKGIALKHLNQNNWKEPIDKAICILELQNNIDLIKIFKDLTNG